MDTDPVLPQVAAQVLPKKKVPRPRKTTQKARGASTAASAGCSTSTGRAVYSIFGSGVVPLEQLGSEHIIVHLNTADTSELSPRPYDACDEFSEVKNMDPAPAQEKGSTDLLPIQTLLGEFQKRTIDGDWPSDTNVWCHWCCHPFDGRPVALPIRIVDGSRPRWEVAGCFCSLNCAAAYNFDANDDSDDVWETYALLNRMFAELSDSEERVLPAPPRSTLKVFGGYMDIDEFRRKSLSSAYNMLGGGVNVCKGSTVDLLRFPMTFVPQQVEEINEANIFQPLRFIPVDHDHINRVKEKQLQLKRSKPLVNSVHTLDRVMNLRIEQ